MPWYPDSFLGATSGWRLDEIGLYHNLLCAQWLTGPLPTDHESLALHGRCSANAFASAWTPRVSGKFVVTPMGLQNIRLEQHRSKSLSLSGFRSDAGKAGAAARWQKDGKRNGKTHGKGHDKEMALSLSLSLSPTPTLSSKKKPRTEGATDCPEFEMFKSVYPGRIGDQGWAEARRRCNARLAEGHTWQEILDGAQRYADQQRALDKINTPYVKKAETFVGRDKHFLEAHPHPANVAERNQDHNLNVSQAFLQRKMGERNG